MYDAKSIGIVECTTLIGDGIPYKVVGLYGLVAALIKVCTGRVTGGRGELGEEHPDKAVGDGINSFPTALNSLCLRNDGRIFGNQAHQFIYIGTEAQEQTCVGIAFNVEVTSVTGHGAEEKFQATVLADLIQKTGQLCANVFLYGT